MVSRYRGVNKPATNKITHHDGFFSDASEMSWAEPADMDTLSDLPPVSVPVGGKVSNLSRGSSSKQQKTSRRVGGASKSERRLLMEAKAGVGAAIAEVRDIYLFWPPV